MSLSPGMVRARPTQQAQRMEEGLAGRGCCPTAIVLWIRAEVPLTTVRVLAGHASLATTDRYASIARNASPRRLRS
jgi:hypothetical protein